METHGNWRVGLRNGGVPTRLEGMETRGVENHYAMALAVPTRLEGMETFGFLLLPLSAMGSDPT